MRPVPSDTNHLALPREMMEGYSKDAELSIGVGKEASCDMESLPCRKYQ